MTGIHTVTVTNRFGNTISTPVVYVKAVGSGKAEVHVETNYHMDVGYDYPATYTTPSKKTKGRYKVSSSEFTERETYIYKARLCAKDSRGGDRWKFGAHGQHFAR